MAAQKVIFYSLVSTPGGPFFAPNPPKAHLALLHKRVPFELREVTYNDLRTTWTERLGKRATVPFVELPDGSFLQGSDTIADWLEETCTNAPSLYLPASALPYDRTSSEYRTAKNYAALVMAGLGDSDSEWAPFFEVSAKGIHDLLPDDGPDSDRKYFVTPAKLGRDGEWERLMSLDQKQLIERCRSALTPVQAVVADTPYLAGTEPGMVDYVVYGRYLMMRAAVPELAVAVWGPLQKWIDAIEARYSDGLKTVLGQMPAL